MQPNSYMLCYFWRVRFRKTCKGCNDCLCHSRSS